MIKASGNLSVLDGDVLEGKIERTIKDSYILVT